MKKIFIMLLAASTLFAKQYSKKEVIEILKPYQDEMMELTRQNKPLVALKFYDDDIVNMVPFREPIQGIEELKSLTREAVRNGLKYLSISGEIMDAWGCDDMLYERGTLAFSQITNHSPKPEAYYGSYFTVWKKQQDGSWKMRYTIFNLDFNPF